MKKSIILSCVLALALVGTLYSLPKVVVNTKAKEVDNGKTEIAAAPGASSDGRKSRPRIGSCPASRNVPVVTSVTGRR